ncbi:hypothetical protein ACRRTK_008590 [Alexandromys fortis]
MSSQGAGLLRHGAPGMQDSGFPRDTEEPLWDTFGAVLSLDRAIEKIQWIKTLAAKPGDLK